MAPSLLKLTTILSLIIPFFLALHTQTILSIDTEEEDYYVLDSPEPNLRSRSRFLIQIIKKGTHCNRNTNNICNGVSANNGTSLLYCCKTHCRNTLRDENNCGVCGHKCNFGENCCNRRCINMNKDGKNCGKCGRQCAPGIKCNNGLCGYA